MNHATAREGSHPARRSGMVTFASYMLIVAGFFHVIAGLAALFRSGVYLVGSGQLVALDYTQWGWVHLLFGVLLFFAATALFSGRMVSAAEALSIGLVDQVVPDADVYSAAVDMVKRYAAGPALALRAAKQAIDAGLGVDLATGLELERVQFAALFGTEDQRAGMRSFLENGPGKATFTGR